jgi:transposase-like protein
MRKGRFSEEQIIAILREQEAGMATAEVCRRHGISSATFSRRRSCADSRKRALPGTTSRRTSRCRTGSSKASAGAYVMSS